MKLKLTLSLFIFFGLIISCKKENQIAKKLVGTWEFTEFKRANGYTKTDFSESKTTLEFSKYKNAYTSTMKGVYRIDYTDPLKIDMVDTFKYQLKRNDIDITFVQKGTNLKFLKNRFQIKDYKSNSLKLVRTDSTDLYILAKK